MKKNITLFIITSIFFIGCNQNRTQRDAHKISNRDYSINKHNSYNDIFLDSAAVENYISKNVLPDSVARRIRSFYNTRNYEFAWFSSNGLSEQAMGFSSLLNFTGDTSAKQKNLHKIMDNLLDNERLTISANSPSIIKTELLLTENLIDYSIANFEKDNVNRTDLERFIPFKKADPIEMADSLLNKKNKGEKYFSELNEPYKLLSEQLKKYLDIAKKGGWPTIKLEPRLFKNGASSPGFISLKKMLTLWGDLPQKDTSKLFNENLRNGIRNFQTRFGFTPDGKVTQQLLAETRIPVIERIKEILINMNRMRWMPQKPEGKLIIVNIPEFTLHIYEGKNEVLSMPVVVGKEGHNTTLFSDKLTTIVFSPYWNVPPSIVKDEIVPAMAKDTSYLTAHDMEITGNENGLPVVRQKPGAQNSLGKVKFLFPNTFNIYFHDTPAKSLFDKDVRAYSHGCIRLSQPEKMAAYLLKDNSKWTTENINAAMNSGKEQNVALKEPVPVFITYYTAWVDEKGVFNFRDDIYENDKDIAKKMFRK
jgi:murein L,D-transpeptidase YcbB/YkuD